MYGLSLIENVID